QVASPDRSRGGPVLLRTHDQRPRVGPATLTGSTTRAIDLGTVLRYVERKALRAELMSRAVMKKNFYESADVKPWQLFSCSLLNSFAVCGRRSSQVHRWVPRLAVLGEAGNPAVLAPAWPGHQPRLIFPPGLVGLSCAFGLVASSELRPPRVGTNFYTC